MSPHEEESINELKTNTSSNNGNVEYNITNPINNDNNSIITSKMNFKKLIVKERPNTPNEIVLHAIIGGFSKNEF